MALTHDDPTWNPPEDYASGAIPNSPQTDAYGNPTGAPSGGGGGGFFSPKWLGGIGSVLGGLSGFFGAKEANKPRTTVTDQTTTQTPYAPTIDHLMRILEEQARIYGQGPIDYSKILGGGGGGGGGLGPRGQQAADIYGRVAEAGLGAGSTPGVLAGMSRIGDIWGGDAGGGAGTGFEGYNPLLADLAGRLGGAGLDTPIGLLMNFLSENDRNQLAGVGGGGGSSGTRSSFNYGPVGTGSGGGGVVPDTGAGFGTFQNYLREMMDEGANEEEIAGVLDSMRGDMERELFGSIADIQAAAAGAGRSGGDWQAARESDARGQMLNKFGQLSAQLRYGDLAERRQAKIELLGLLNNRDIAAMMDATNRAGINASASSAAAANATAEKLGLRAQDLEAIMGIMQGNQFGLDQLLRMGGQLSSDRLGSLGLIPSFEGLGLAGQQNALGAAGGLAGLEASEAAARARASGNRERMGLAQANAQQELLNNYLRTVLGIAGTGATSTTQGTNVVPGAGVSPLGAAASGALGGGLAGYGLATEYGRGR